MRDLLFSGQDVEEAVALACQVLGVPKAGLHFVVLAQGAPGRFGGAPTPAQIAVMVDQPGRPGALPPPPPRRLTAEELVGLFTQAAGLDLHCSVRESEAGRELVLGGPDTAFLLEEEAAVLRALDHLLQRVVRQQAGGRAILTCEGYREWRDQCLREQARALAAEVLGDGRSRATGPLNSYERRIVHLALEAVAGVTTFSVGEGGERRVTVALSAPEPSSSSPPVAEP